MHSVHHVNKNIHEHDFFLLGIKKMIIAEKITAIREALHLDKKAFAAEIHVSPSYVTQIEKGIKIPSDTLLDLIMKKWGVAIDWWEVGEGEIFTKTKADVVTPASVNPVVVAAMNETEFSSLPVDEQVAIIYQWKRNIAGRLVDPSKN